MSTSQTKKQRTIKRACEYCKKKHIKCDGTSPCYQCERRNIPCVYSVPKTNNITHTDTPVYPQEEKVFIQPISGEVSQIEESFLSTSRPKRKEPDKKRKKIKEFKFIPIKNEKIINNNVITKSPPDGTWLQAYKKKVEPFISFDSSNTPTISHFNKILSSDYFKLRSLPTQDLVDMLSQFTLAAHGSRYCDNLEISVRSIYKSLDIFEALQSKNALTIPEHAQTLAGNIESIIFYLSGHGDIYKTRELITHAQYLLNNFSHSLLPSTRRTIYAFLVGKSMDYDEMELWVNKAKTIPIENFTQSDVSSWVVLAIYMTFNPLATLDKPYFPNLEPSQHPRELKHYQFVLSILEQAETIVWNYESFLTQTNVNNPIPRIYKLVLYGHKSYLLCKCGFLDEALSYANEVIQSGLPEICKLPFVLSLYNSCAVAIFMHKHSLYIQGIELLNSLISQYPLWKSQVNELTKEFSRIIGVYGQPSITNDISQDFRDDSDGSTHEYNRSPTSLEENPSYLGFIEDKDNILGTQLALNKENPYEQFDILDF